MRGTWYVRAKGWKEGPYSTAQLHEMFTRGELAPSTPIRSETDQVWVAAHEVLEFFPSRVVPPPIAVRDTALAEDTSGRAITEDGPWLNRGIGFISVLAVIVVVVLVSVIIARTLARNKEQRLRGLAADRIAVLQEEIIQALADRNKESAKAHYDELMTLAARFTGLVDADTANRIRDSIQAHAGRWKAEEIFAAVQDALAKKQLALLVDRSKAYLREPYATEIPKAKTKSLLADAELILAKEAGDKAMVEAWTKAELDEFLRSGELPKEMPIADKALRDSYHTRLRYLASRVDVQRKNEEEEEQRQAALVAAERLRRETDRLRKEKEELERVEAPQRKLLEAGILGLIPQDAVGALGVASVDQVLNRLNDAQEEIIKVRFADKDVASWLPFFASIPPNFVKNFLKSQPFNLYKQDQPLALVFANPTKAGIAFPAHLFDLFNATWGQNTTLLENLGVVVGTPNDVATVEGLLKLAAGSLAGGDIQHATLQYMGKDKKLSVLLRGGRLYVGFTVLSVNSVAESLGAKESLAATIDLRGGMRMASRDALVHIGLGAWKKEWDNWWERWETPTLAADKHDEAALELADSFATIMRRTTSFLLGVKLDKGVEVSLLALLSRDDEALLERFQLLLGKGAAPPTLSGLPHDDALGAFATRGNRPWDYFVTQALYSLPLRVEKRIMLASAFREVWNQVQGTRGAVYFFEKPVVVVVLDTNDPVKFIDRLEELVKVWDELADGDELKAIERVAITKDVFDGRTAYCLSFTDRGVAGLKLTLVPIRKQMVLSFGEDDAPLREAIKNVTADMPLPGLAEHPGILESYKRLPAHRELELHLRLSELLNMTAERKLVGVGPAEYSSARLALGKTSLELDVWIPLGEFANLLMRYAGKKMVEIYMSR